LLDAVEEYRRSGTIPWRSDEIDFAAIRALAVTFPKEQDWRQFAPDYLAHKAAAE
jgi:hypothetical protein